MGMRSLVLLVGVGCALLVAAGASSPVSAQFDDDAEAGVGEDELGEEGSDDADLDDEGLGDEGLDDEGFADADGSETEDLEGETGEAPESDGASDSGMALAFGLKIGGGGNLLPTPDPAPMGLPFDDGVGGYAFTVGGYAELRILDGLVGFQTGLLFDFVTNLSELSTPTGDQTWGWSATDLRVPILVQIGTPGEGTRLYATTGPEVVLGMSAERTSDTFGPLAVQSDTHANWLVGIGLASPISVLRLSFDIQFAYNLGAKGTYAERVSGSAPFGTLSVQGQHAMDLRLLIGAAYGLSL